MKDHVSKSCRVWINITNMLVIDGFKLSTRTQVFLLFTRFLWFFKDISTPGNTKVVSPNFTFFRRSKRWIALPKNKELDQDVMMYEWRCLGFFHGIADCSKRLHFLTKRILENSTNVIRSFSVSNSWFHFRLFLPFYQNLELG